MSILDQCIYTKKCTPNLWLKLLLTFILRTCWAWWRTHCIWCAAAI